MGRWSYQVCSSLVGKSESRPPSTCFHLLLASALNALPLLIPTSYTPQ